MYCPSCSIPLRSPRASTHRAIHMKPAVPPGLHLPHHAGLNQPFLQQQAKHLLLPQPQKRLVRQIQRHGHKMPFGSERTIRDQPVQVGMKVNQAAEGLDRDDPAGPRSRPRRAW